jgi:hypothetical protein
MFSIEVVIGLAVGVGLALLLMIFAGLVDIHRALKDINTTLRKK